MVHALEEIRRLLCSDGTLIDIHPVREEPRIEVEARDGIRFSETYPGYDYDEDLRQAEDALDQVVARGLFVSERSCEFDSRTYASSCAELRDHLAEAGAYSEGPKDDVVLARRSELYARAEEVMKAVGEPAEVVCHERARMTRLTPAHR